MDIENVPQKRGFPAVAGIIAANPDYEAFIFRKFDWLSARNLLRLESRLAYLERKLDQEDEQAERGDNETLRSLRSWEAFQENAENASRPEHARMKLEQEMGEALNEYREIGPAVWNVSPTKEKNQKKHCCANTK